VFFATRHTYQTKFHRPQKSRNGNEEATVEEFAMGEKAAAGAGDPQLWLFVQ